MFPFLSYSFFNLHVGTKSLSLTEAMLLMWGAYSVQFD